MKMGYLKNKTVYLSGPITSANDDGVGWRKDITVLLNDFGLNVEDPTITVVGGTGEIGKDKALFKELLSQKKFRECKERFWPVCRKDLRAVDRSDFLIFYYDPDIKMFGTIDEVITASRLQKKPVLMMISEDKIKDMNPWALVLVKEECIFTSWVDMFNYLQTIDEEGPTGSQTSYWTL